MRTRNHWILLGVSLLLLLAAALLRPAHERAAAPAGEPAAVEPEAGPPPSLESSRAVLRETMRRRGAEAGKSGGNLGEQEAINQVLSLRGRERFRYMEAEGKFGYHAPGYGVSFLPDEVRFALREKVEGFGVPGIRYALESVTAGDEVLAVGGPMLPQLDRATRTVTYDRGRIQERYLVLEDALEHIVVLPEPPASPGDVTVRVRVRSQFSDDKDICEVNRLEGCEQDGRVLFRGKGRDMIAVSDAVAIDANGRRQRLDLRYRDGRVLFSVPQAWLEEAAYPVLIDPVVGSTISVRAGTTATKSPPVSAAYNSTSDEWLVVWCEQFGGSAFDYNVRGQRISNSGALSGAVIDVAVSSQGEYECAVAYASTVDDYLVVWRHDNDDDGDVEDQFIMGRLVNADGTFPGVAFLVQDVFNATSLSGQDMEPDVAFDGTYWLVVFTNRYDTDDWNIVGEFVEDDGTPLTLVAVYAPIGVTDAPRYPKVDFRPGSSNRHLVVWQQSVTAGGPYDIYGRLVTPGSAVLIGNAFAIDEGTDTNMFPDVASAGIQYLVTWQTETTVANHDIMGRIVGDSGTSWTLVSGELTIDAGSSDQLHPRAAWSGAAINYFVAWDDNAAGNGDIYGKRLNSDGSLPVSAAVHIYTNSNQDHWPVLSLNSTSNELLVAWKQETSGDVLALRYGIDASSPSVPTGLTPDGTATGTSPVVLDWSDSTDTGGAGVKDYDVQVAATSAFTTPVHSNTVVASTDSVSGLTDGLYYWRVRARDNDGNVSAWSATATFTLDTTNPTLPVLLSPVNGAMIDDNTTLFDWTDSYDLSGVTYAIQVTLSTDPTYSSPVVNQSGLVGSAYLVSAPLADNTYIWRVQATDGVALTSGWTSDFTFVLNTAGGNSEPDDVAAGTLSQHDTPAGAAQAVGFVDDDMEMTFKGTVADTTDGDNVAIQVELKAVGIPFDGKGLYTGTFVASGGQSQVTVPGLVHGRRYQWRARAYDGLAGSINWTNYGANVSYPPTSPADTDFRINVTSNNAPDDVAAATLSQHDTPYGGSASVGFVDDDTEMTFKGRVVDTTDGGNVAIQVEVSPINTAFNGANVFTGIFVPSGGISEVTVPGLNNSTQFQWRARAYDGAASSASWTNFGGNNSYPPAFPADVDFGISTGGNTNPNDISAATLSQRDSAGGAGLPPGSTISDNEIIFLGIVTDPDGGIVAMEVEYKPVGTAFDGSGTVTGSFVSSGDISYVAVPGLTDGDYQWRARANDGSLTSNWLDFGANASNPPATTAAIDFTVSLGGNSAPSAVAVGTLSQHDSAADSAAAAGSLTSTDDTVVMRGTVVDSDSATAALQVEVKPTVSHLDGATFIFTGNQVTSGSTSEVTISGLPDESYQWRARAIDFEGLVSPTWTDFGGNNSNPPTIPADTDFVIAVVPPPAPPAVGSSGEDSCVGSASRADSGGRAPLAALLALLGALAACAARRRRVLASGC